jgi:hypothetical protein
MRDAAGRSRCFAFLTFEDPASVNAVMVKEHFLDGKIVGLFRFSTPSLLLICKYIDVDRLTPNEPFPDKSTNGRRSFSLGVWQAASLPSLCASSSLSSGKSSIRLSCWIVRQDGVKVLGLSVLKIQMYNRFLGLGIWRLMARWYSSNALSAIALF